LRVSRIGNLLHLALIGFLIASGVLMAVAMIPLIVLILAGWGIFNLTTPRKPRELTRRAALGASGNSQ
jgi:hypothetical protein